MKNLINRAKKATKFNLNVFGDISKTARKRLVNGSKTTRNCLVNVSSIKWLKIATLFLIITIGVGSVWGAHTVVKAGDMVSGEKYIITAEYSGTTYYLAPASFSTGGGSAASYTTSLTEAAAWTFTESSSSWTISTVVGSTTYYLGNTNTNNGVQSTTTSQTWTIGEYSSGSSTVKITGNNSRNLALYQSSNWRCYSSSSGVQNITLYKVSGSGTNYTVNSAVSPTGTGSVALGSTSLSSGSTTTATATANSGYVFDHWAISGTGTTLSSTTTNPTTITMGSATSTITAYFVAKTAASITLSIAGSTSSVSGYYVSDSYTLPLTAAACSGKTFVGWSKVAISTPVSTKPTSNYYEPGESVTLAASQTFYAVYATASGGGSGSCTLDYSEETSLSSSADWGSYGTAYTYTDENGCKKEWVIKAYKSSGMQINTGKDASIKIPTFSGNITSIEITGSTAKAVGFSESDYAGSGTITYVVEGTDATSQTLSFAGKTYTTGYIVPKSGSISITKIVVNYSSATYSGYTTSCVACGTPTLNFSSATLTKKISESGFTFAATATGNTLGATISYSSSNTTKATVNSSGVVTLLQSTIDGSPVTITATLPYTENGAGTECQNEVTASYTLNIKNDITWISNEAAVASGSQTTEAFYNGTITAIPSTPSVPSACSSKAFVGWTTVADWDSDEAPDPLYTSVADFSSLKIRENKTFYAVFASTTTGDPVSTLTQTLEYDTWTYSGTTTDKDSYRMFGDEAYIESAAFDLSKLSQVVVYGGTYGGDSYSDISIKSASGTEWATESFTSTNQNKAYTITSSTSLSGTQALRIYSESGNGTTNGVRISKVEIYTMVASVVGTGYITKCCTEWDDPTMTVSKNSFAVGEADATITKSSGTTHGTLSYSTSDASIATVSKSGTTGTVQAVSPGNVTITASWSKDGSYCAKEMTFNFTITGNCTVTFDANGGTGSMANQVVPYSTSTALNTMSGLSKAGMTFVGWNTAADGSGNAYADGANIKLTSNITLYAQWGEAYTITLHRNGATEAITVLSTEFPYTLPTNESDYCDAWIFDGWSATSVANNSDSYTKVTQATTAESAHFYAVYRGASGNSADAYVRISKLDELTSGSKYIFVGLESGKKYVMPNSYSSTYNNFSGIQINEDGKDYYLKATIEDDHAGCVYIISGSANNWTINNNSSSSYYLNTYYETWWTTNSTKGKYSITPNGLFWTVNNTQGTSCNAQKSFIEFYKTGSNYVFARTTTKYGSAALQIYKLGTTELYKYTSTPSGGDCSVACTASGAEFTYPSMEKSTSSADFTNTVVYPEKENTNTSATTYTSSKTDVATVTSAGVVSIVGKGKTTITMTQGRDNTDPSHPICGVTISYELTVIDPSLEVVEVTGDDKIVVEHDFPDGITNASVDSSKVDIKGTIADDIFISKYYEAASHMKLIGLYNGTEHNIDMSELRVLSGSSTWGTHGNAELGKMSKLLADYPEYLLPPFTEIILWSNIEGQANNDQLCSCVSMTIGGKVYDYEDMKAGNVPNWYRIGTAVQNELDADGNKPFNFNGNDAIILERSTDNGAHWTAIDLLGAGSLSSPKCPELASWTGGAGATSNNGKIDSLNVTYNDDPGYYWRTSTTPDSILSTNRFYLTRLSSVKSGQDAVEKNTSTFVTLGEEWKGRGIGGNSRMEDFCSSGELFSEVAQYDYAGYYTDYVEYAEGWTATDNNDGTFTLQFETGKLDKLACKQLQIYVENSDGTKSAQVEYRVPIIVKTTTDVTQSALFNKHDKDECKVCDVAIVSGGVLTKSKPTTPADVAADREQVYNVDVYGGGELYIPTGTTYTVNTLTVRSTGDAVGVVDVQGTLKRNNTTLIHSKRFHNAGSDWRWYYFSLPYDCNVSEVTFSNGDPAIHGVDFEIDWFDGEQRASTQAGGNWKSIASHPDYPNVIKAGYGYTIAVEEKSGHTNVSLIFPMANFSEPTQVNVPVGNWGAGDDDVTVNHKGWNVVGNPFLTKYKAQEDVDVNGELREGLLVNSGGGWTQTADGVNYATIPQNGGKSGYTQEALTNHLFNPFQSFIIQVGGDAERNDLAVQLKNTYKNKRASIIRRSEAEYEAGALEPVKLRVNLTNANSEMDKTTLIISDKYTPEYDMTYDLTKWRGTSYRNYTQPVLASVYGGQELAFNALPDSVVANSVPLTCYSRNAGKMAFELSSDYPWNAFEEVILHDKVLGVNHNLLTNGKYEFDAAAGETGERFAISAVVNRYKSPAITTGTDLVDLQNVQLTVQEHSLLLNGLEPGTTVYVFDMLGRLVGRKTCSGQFTTFVVPATGVYNVRLEGKKAGYTLRAIVK